MPAPKPPTPEARDRMFWTIVRRALLMIAAAIEERHLRQDPKPIDPFTSDFWLKYIRANNIDPPS